MLGDPRKCPERFSLQGAVCKECDDVRCVDCSSRLDTCEKCEEGFYSTKEGTCEDCDSYKEEVRCKKCGKSDSGNVVCLECGEGYRLE